MTSGQEGIVITKIQIYTELLQKFGVSETKFCPYPPVLQSSDQVPSIIIPQNKPKSVLVHHLKGHKDWTTLSRVKGGVKVVTNPETPCMSNVIYNTKFIRLLSCRSSLSITFENS